MLSIEIFILAIFDAQNPIMLGNLNKPCHEILFKLQSVIDSFMTWSSLPIMLLNDGL